MEDKNPITASIDWLIDQGFDRKQAAAPCTLVLPGNIRLKLTTLPTPQWLGELIRSAQGAH